MAINRIDQTPARLSTNVTVGRQTQGSTFGERMHAGLQQAGNVIANGASLVGGALPGGAIISAAVSSVTNMAGGAASASYAAQGTVNVGGSGGGINTTVGSGSVVGAGSGAPNLSGGGASNTIGQMNTDVAQATADNAKLLQVQISMQRENQVFSSVSNVLKTKHDTVKNSISNIR